MPTLPWRPLALTVLLAACTNENVIPQATTGQAGLPNTGQPNTGQPNRGMSTGAPAGSVTRFDGRYAGIVEKGPDRTRECPPAPPGEREIIVRQGRISFVFDPRTRGVLTGTVQPDGNARISDPLDRAIATTGAFLPEHFAGEHRNGRCIYIIRFPKRG